MYCPFEVLYLLVEPFLPYLYRRVRSDLRSIVQAYKHVGRSEVVILDVGARKSHYTIGLKAKVVLMDIPRENQIQHQLNLGVTDDMLAQLRRRRSNVVEYILQDFTVNTLPDCSFDIVTAIEVIEHVQNDRQFVQEAFRVLKPGGLFYLTTPNGIAQANTNPDHVRHYTKRELEELLSIFDEVKVSYAIKKSRYRNWGLHSWSINRPFITVKSMIGNFLNSFEKVRFPIEAAHLIAYGVKRV